MPCKTLRISLVPCRRCMGLLWYTVYGIYIPVSGQKKSEPMLEYFVFQDIQSKTHSDKPIDPYYIILAQKHQKSPRFPLSSPSWTQGARRSARAPTGQWKSWHITMAPTGHVLIHPWSWVEVLVFAESTGLITKPFPLDQFRDKTTMDMGSKLGPKNPVPGPKVWRTPMDMDMRLRKSGYFTFKTFQNWCWFLYGCKLNHVGFSSVFTVIFPGSPGFFFQKKRVRPPVPHTSISTRWPCHLHPSRASCCPPCSEGNPSPWSNIKIFTVS